MNTRPAASGLYCVEGLTIEEIAKWEKVKHQSVSSGSSPPKNSQKIFGKVGAEPPENQR